MSKNDTLRQIGEQLEKAKSVLLFPHVFVDGDALGSSVALCRALRNMGKEVYILIEDPVPEYLAFLDRGYCTMDPRVIKNPDVCVCVDCADIERFVLRKEKFLQGKLTVCIDHHMTSGYFAGMNYIESGAAATAEIVYGLLHEMKAEIDKETGEAIYAAIATDTGNFQYSNTTARTHNIAAELLSAGIDHNYVSRSLYQNARMEKLMLSGKILGTLRSLASGQAVMAYVTQEMLAEVGARMEDTEGTAELLRSLKGVELSIFAKETGPSEAKFSMRSKTWINVSEISVKYGGGGHMRAAGCTLKLPVPEAMKLMEAEIEQYFKKQK